MAPKDVHVLIPGTMNMLPYVAKGTLQSTDLERKKLSWMIRVGLK